MCTRLHKPVVPSTTYYFILYGASYFPSAFPFYSQGITVLFLHKEIIKCLSIVLPVFSLRLFADLFPLSPLSHICLCHCYRLSVSKVSSLKCITLAVHSYYFLYLLAFYLQSFSRRVSLILPFASFILIILAAQNNISLIIKLDSVLKYWLICSPS